MLIRCIFEYFQKKRKVLMINAINSNINVKMLLLVFSYKKCVSKHSITHVLVTTIINYAKLYILINYNYMKFLYILFKKGEFYLSTVTCEISKFPKKLMQFQCSITDFSPKYWKLQIEKIKYWIFHFKYCKITQLSNFSIVDQLFFH